MSNPWKLTPRQCETLSTLASVGCTKLAARELDCAAKTIEQHVHAAKRSMGIEHRVQAIVAYDRLARDQA